jgi:glycosyltransferase involved in cell wall biosynthesis
LPLVLLYIDTDVFAGTESHVESLALSLGIQNVEVAIACPVGSALAKRAAETGIRVYAVGRCSIGDGSPLRALRDLLRSGEVDLIHAHNGRTALTAAVAVKLAGRGSCVATQHFLEPHRTGRRGPAAWASRLAHHWVNKHTSHQIAVSQAAREGILSRREAAPDAVTVVPNGIAPPDIATLTRTTEVREQLGIPSDVVLIVCASRLEPEKDVTTLLEAMPLLPASPPVKLLLAGAGSQEVVLRDKIRDWGLTDCVSLLGFRDDVMSLINAADIFVLPSKAEPFGLVLLEAMSLAKPVVATAAGGPLEIVVHEETGLLVPPGSPAALADAMQTLILDPVRRTEIGNRGLLRFKERFTADRMAAGTLSVYRRILGPTFPGVNSPRISNQSVVRVADTADTLTSL